MVTCSFCRYNIPIGTGTMFVKNDGRILLFCGSKCEKNLLKLERVPRRTKWTGAYGSKAKGAA